MRALVCAVSAGLRGGRRRGKDRGYHFRIAAGSTAELAAGIRFAIDWEFCAPQPELFALVDRELAIFGRLERVQR